MRVVVVETDTHGRSGVGQIIERTGAPSREASCEVFSGPVTKAAHPDGQEDFVDLSPGAGAAKWRIYDLPPNLVYEMHHTDTVDFDVVVEGSMTLVLDRDEVILQPGDGVLLAGDRHSRRAGSRGCRMLFALPGTPETP